MRICIVTTSYPSYLGDPRGKMIHDLAYHLVPMGVTVDVVAPVNADAQTGTTSLNGVSVHRFAYPFFGTKRFDLRRPGEGGIPYVLKHSWGAIFTLPLFVLAFMRATLSYARQSDLIHAQWLPTALMTLCLKPFHRKPVLVTVRGSDMAWALESRFVRRLLFRLVHGIDHFIAVSEKYAEQLHTELHIPKEKISCVQNGIDTTEFAPTERKEEIRRNLGFPPDKPCILYVGNVIAQKGVLHLFDAWLTTLRNGHDAYLVFIGGGSAMDTLAARAAEENLTNQVWLLGKQSNRIVADWMKAADLFVFPTMHPEGVSQVIKEAMASALPVITTPAGGIPEVIQDGRTGFFVPQGDSEVLAQRLNELLQDPQLCAVIGEQARKWIVNSDLSIEHTVPKVKAIYDRVLQSPEKGTL